MTRAACACDACSAVLEPSTAIEGCCALCFGTCAVPRGRELAWAPAADRAARHAPKPATPAEEFEKLQRKLVAAGAQRLADAVRPAVQKLIRRYLSG